MSLPAGTLVENLRTDGKCVSCDKKVSAESFLNEKSHKKSCQFRSGLLPFIAVTINPVINTRSGYDCEPDELTSGPAASARNIPALGRIEEVTSTDPSALFGEGPSPPIPMSFSSPRMGTAPFPVPYPLGANQAVQGVFSMSAAPPNAITKPAPLEVAPLDDRSPPVAAAAVANQEDRMGSLSSYAPVPYQYPVHSFTTI